jgi:hypothetical protein
VLAHKIEAGADMKGYRCPNDGELEYRFVTCKDAAHDTTSALQWHSGARLARFGFDPRGDMPDMKPESDWANANLSPSAADYYQNSFLPRYKEYIERVNRTSLMVLLWGPGESGGDLYDKRQQIRRKLLQENVAAVFSEQIDLDVPLPDWSTKARELLQALAADLIVILQASPGSIAEAHDFAEFIEDIGRKMLIFIDKNAEHGYACLGALAELREYYSNVHTFDYPKDIQECNLLTAVLKRIRVMRYVKWRQLNVR